MLALDDPRWAEMAAGYKVPFDPRPLLEALASGRDREATWHALWGELHHQGDVGEASYAAVPHLVRIQRQLGRADWNTYALVATIELARDSGTNPAVPDWLAEGYRQAIQDLAAQALQELPHVTDAESVRSMLGMIAIAKGARVYGRVLVEFTEDEVQELEAQAFGSGGRVAEQADAADGRRDGEPWRAARS